MGVSSLLAELLLIVEKEQKKTKFRNSETELYGDFHEWMNYSAFISTKIT